MMQTDFDQPKIETSNNLHFSVGIGSPAPAIRIKLASIIAMTIDPAQIERREDSHGDLESVGMFHGQVEGRESTHAHAGKDVGFAFRADRVVLLKEIPDVMDDVILEIASIGIDEETARGEDTRPTVDRP